MPREAISDQTKSSLSSSPDEVIFPHIPDKRRVVLSSTDAESPTPKKQRVLAGNLKAYCWRLTASYLWIKFLLGLLGWQSVLDQLESRLSLLVVNLQSSVGINFAPVSSFGFLTILKVGWLLVITGVRPLQLFGLLIYVIIFPISVIIYLIAGVTKWEQEVKEAKIAREVKQERRERGRIVLSALLLFVWLLLYGGANTLRQIVPGLIFSGALFLFLTLRLFQRARPDSDARYFRPLLSVARSLISTENTQIKTLLEEVQE